MALSLEPRLGEATGAKRTPDMSKVRGAELFMRGIFLCPSVLAGLSDGAVIDIVNSG
jgi:hypothetical protein